MVRLVCRWTNQMMSWLYKIWPISGCGWPCQSTFVPEVRNVITPTQTDGYAVR